MILPRSVRYLLGLLCASICHVLDAQPTKEWRQGNPSGEEQHALEIINRIRSGPEDAVRHYARLAPGNAILAATFASVQTYVYADGFVGIDPAYFSQTPVDSLRGEPAVLALVRNDVAGYARNPADNRRAPPLPPFALYPMFIDLARTRSSAALEQVSARGPVFAGDRVIFVQLERTILNAPSISGANATGGTASTFVGGATATGAFTAGELMAVATMPPNMFLREAFIARSAVFSTWMDDSYTSRRVGSGGSGFVITPGRTRMIGLHVGSPRSSGPGEGSRVLSVYGTDNEAFEVSDLPYGTQTVFVTGVVYQDLNKDGDYNIGEGVGGLRVEIEGGEWFATTSASGGYSIPVRPGSGAAKVRLSGNVGPSSTIPKDIQVAGENIKVDFVVSTAVKPPQVLVPASEGNSRLANLSTRGIAGRGANALSGGFVVSGSARKRVLIRAVANGILPFGLKGVLRKPLLVVQDASGAVLHTTRTQDTYGGFESLDPATQRFAVRAELAAAFAGVGAFPLPGVEHSGRFGGDVAVIADLPPGAYTVNITPDTDTPIFTLNEKGVAATEEDPAPNGETYGSLGLVLLEVYDGATAIGRFSNLSTRGLVGTGERSMIVGFVVSGTGRSRVVLRGIGPGLTAFGVAGALSFTNLELRRADGSLVAANDGWGGATWSDQSVSLSQAVGAFALAPDTGDSVVVAQLPAGSYGLALKSGNGNPGVALAEVYENP